MPQVPKFVSENDHRYPGEDKDGAVGEKGRGACRGRGGWHPEYIKDVELSRMGFSKGTDSKGENLVPLPDSGQMQ